MLRIDETEVFPAAIDGSGNNAFVTPTFIFCKPRWISDQDAHFCAICRSKFNQIRRRHHCRSCGKVFCNKCCTEKVPLPQYGLDNPERVCSACVSVASCVTMSYSNDPSFHLRSVTGLSSLCRDCPAAVVALGGAHVLISLVKKTNPSQLQTLACIASGLHSLSQHECLAHWLTDIGALSAITQILSASCEAAQLHKLIVITDSLGTLRLLAKSSDKLKALAFDTGCFPILLKLCDHINSGVSLVATSTLCLLAECAQNHSVFISQEDALRSLLMRVTKSVDEQVKEHVLRIVVVLSTGDAEVKHIIASEDAASGGVLAHALQSQPHNQQIIASAAAAIANMATNEKDQVLLQSSMRAILNEIQHNYPEYVIIQLMRAAANFAQHSCHASTLLLNLGSFVNLLNSKGSKINCHAVRCIVNLLRHRNKETVSLLCRNGIEDFLLRFSELDDVMNQVVKSLSIAAPPITSS